MSIETKLAHWRMSDILVSSPHLCFLPGAAMQTTVKVVFEVGKRRKRVGRSYIVGGIESDRPKSWVSTRQGFLCRRVSSVAAWKADEDDDWPRGLGMERRVGQQAQKLPGLAETVSKVCYDRSYFSDTTSAAFGGHIHGRCSTHCGADA